MRTLLLLFVILFVCSCEKETSFDDIITKIELSKNELVANGLDTLSIKISFSDDAILDKTKLSISASNGVFTDSMKDIIELSPKQDALGRVFAEAVLQSTTKVSNHDLKFELLPFEKSMQVVSVRSEPSSIKLISNSFSVGNNFTSEVLLEGAITNSNGQKVSDGVRVEFFDEYIDGTEVNGLFRNSKLMSGGDSKVSSIYTPGVIEADQNIIIKAIIVDGSGNPIGIEDSVEIFVKLED